MTTFDHPMFGWERDHEGIVLVTMDDTDQSANTMNTRFQAELPMLVDHLYAERDSLTGVLITSLLRKQSNGAPTPAARAVLAAAVEGAQVDFSGAERGKTYSAKILDKALAAGRTTPEQRDETLARIVPTTGLADGGPAPENFLGLHFFSPVDKMALLEIVVGAKTSDATLAKAVDVAVQIGKSPIVVNDSRGFFTSRVIVKFINEALAMVGEGVSPVSVERAATQAGYPVGALTLIDELTLTLARNIRNETIEAVVAEGGAAPEYAGAAVVDRMIDEFGRTGRSAGGGFYEYADGRRTGLWSGLSAFGGGVRIPFVDMQERMLFAEALDTVRCLEEGVLRSVTDANVGSILGIGFPAWTGGVLQYIDQYAGGAAGFVARARELADRYGDRFTPPESLVRKAESSEVYA